MAMFGKALGNGYAITAVIGRHEVMEAAQSIFISSTFWTERIGPSAALKTIEVMESLRSWEVITETGRRIQKRWEQLAACRGLKLDFWGIPSLCGFTIRGPHSQAYKTLITQEMLGRGFLAGTSVYISTAHTQDVVDSYFESLDPVFELIGDCENGRPVESLLKGPVCHSGFNRLN